MEGAEGPDGGREASQKVESQPRGKGGESLGGHQGLGEVSTTEIS